MGEHRKDTRIQREKRRLILKAALGVFSKNGLGAATLDQIATAAGISKPLVVYYFGSKEAIYSALLESLLERWQRPLKNLSEEDEPLDAILDYVREKLRMSQRMPRESKLFASEILRGAPMTRDQLSGDLKTLVDQKAKLIAGWSAQGKLAQLDPYHLIFSIWALTQHYADFGVQVQAILGPERKKTQFNEAERFLTEFFTRALRP